MYRCIASGSPGILTERHDVLDGVRIELRRRRHHAVDVAHLALVAADETAVVGPGRVVRVAGDDGRERPDEFPQALAEPAALEHVHEPLLALRRGREELETALEVGGTAARAQGMDALAGVAGQFQGYRVLDDQEAVPVEAGLLILGDFEPAAHPCGQRPGVDAGTDLGKVLVVPWRTALRKLPAHAAGDVANSVLHTLQPIGGSFAHVATECVAKGTAGLQPLASRGEHRGFPECLRAVRSPESRQRGPRPGERARSG